MRLRFWRRRRPEVEYRFKVDRQGAVISLKVEVGYVGTGQSFTSFTVIMGHEEASRLHRDLSLAAEAARLYELEAPFRETMAKIERMVSWMMTDEYMGRAFRGDRGRAAVTRPD